WSLAFLVILPLAAPRIWAWREVLISHWRRLFLLAGLGMGVTVAPQYIGARETSAANIALIFAACPALVVLLETAIWRTTLGWKRLGGMLTAVCGILVVLSRGNPWALAHLQFGRGDGWVLVAACSWATYTVLSKRCPLPQLPGTVRLGALIAGGAVSLAPFALLESLQGSTPDFSDGRLYLMLAFLAVVPSLGAYFCYDRLVGVAGPSGASISMYMVPLYATLAAWPLLGEAPMPFHMAGFALILAGTVLSGKQQPRSA
ncbi:MAG TPA: DMT family transporter, partial [Rhodocyclaceae bacterium]|nr:DMT family transporter [Rhodocyclaceae bacterium]